LLTEKHRGFAFVEFELAEDAAAAIDNLASVFLALVEYLSKTLISCDKSVRWF